MELKDLQKRIEGLESRVGILEKLVKRIINAIRSAAGQLRGIDDRGEDKSE